MYVKPQFKRYKQATHKLCKFCDTPFTPENNSFAVYSNKIYCSTKCQQVAHHIRRAYSLKGELKVKELLKRIERLILSLE